MIIYSVKWCGKGVVMVELVICFLIILIIVFGMIEIMSVIYCK